MIFILAIIIILVIMAFYTFMAGGIKRNIKELFFGYYYAEDAVTSPDDVPNSEMAITKCVDAGIAVKIPVWLSRDGTVFVSTYNDLSKEYGRDILITTSTADELSAAGLLTLEYALSLIDGKVPCLVELKVSDKNEELVRKVANVINKADKQNIGVATFHPGMLAWYKHTEKKIYRALLSAPAKDFVGLSKLDAFMQGNLMNNSTCRPQLVIYRNKPVSALVKFSYALGTPNGTFLLTDAEEAKALEEEKDVIVIRGFMPEKGHYKDLPELELANSEFLKEAEEKRRLKEERLLKKAEVERKAEEYKEKSRAAKGKGPSKEDKKSVYLFDEEEFGPIDYSYDEEAENSEAEDK